ncbi:MAG: PaaI family thioesterase, partial [Coriobacteriaceae bacterium]
MAKRLSDHPTLEELNDFFGHDRFAEHAGCRIVEGSRDHAVCELDIKDHHRNALGNVMGGAIFTLADFALAIASNTGENPSVSVSSTIEYLSASKGTCSSPPATQTSPAGVSASTPPTSPTTRAAA